MKEKVQPKVNPNTQPVGMSREDLLASFRKTGWGLSNWTPIQETTVRTQPARGQIVEAKPTPEETHQKLKRQAADWAARYGLESKFSG